jgi:hypothetical protein
MANAVLSGWVKADLLSPRPVLLPPRKTLTAEYGEKWPGISRYLPELLMSGAEDPVTGAEIARFEAISADF